MDLWKNQEEIPPPLYVNPNEGGNDGPIPCSLIPNRFVRKKEKSCQQKWDYSSCCGEFC